MAAPPSARPTPGRRVVCPMTERVLVHVGTTATPAVPAEGTRDASGVLHCVLDVRDIYATLRAVRLRDAARERGPALVGDLARSALALAVRRW